MSLSFVSSAVQTATADGGYEEKKIESKQIDAINQRNAHKPLFEQLRQNQDEEQAKQEEMQREIMRGTRALDDEDVAHLDALEKQRLEREREMQRRTQDELLLFRAARAERQQSSVEGEDEYPAANSKSDPEAEVANPSAAQAPAMEDCKQKPSAPRVIVKKRKRRVEQHSKDDDMTPKRNDEKMPEQSEEKPKKEEKPDADESKDDSRNAGGFGSLLSGYGSSDDESVQ